LRTAKWADIDLEANAYTEWLCLLFEIKNYE
jgi:hypothetical protein